MQYGQTAIYYAAAKEKWGLVRLLLERKADPNIAGAVRLIMGWLTPNADTDPYPNPDSNPTRKPEPTTEHSRTVGLTITTTITLAIAQTQRSLYPDPKPNP